VKALSLFLLCFLPLIGNADSEFRGQTPGGANYRILLPTGWQPGAGLVLYHHGFNSEPVGENPDFGPFVSTQLAQGHAIAASAYSQPGWALTRAIDDNLELITRFRQQFGDPGAVYSFGGSMGGLIAVKLAERTQLAGVLSLCAPLAGVRNWERAFDLRLMYDSVCAGVGGGELERGAEPFSWALNLDQIPADLSDFSSIRLLRLIARLNQCTGANLPPGLRTSGMRDRFNKLKSLNGFTNDDYFVLNMGYAVYGLSDLLRQPDKLNSQNPFDSRFVDYGDSSINAGVARVASNPFARLDFALQTSLQGPFGNVPIVSLHTNRDELVDWRNARALTPLVAPNRLLQAYVREENVAHCEFNLAEGISAWNALRAWSRGAPQPSIAQLQSGCLALAGNPATPGPCRIDASLLPGPLDEKLRPRNLTLPALDGRFSGIWWNPARAGEGFVIEMYSSTEALIYMFTYPPVGSTSVQAWFGGVGKLVNGALEIADATITRGARFGAQFNPTNVITERWGRLSFVPSACGQAELRAIGSAAFGTQTIALTQLSQIGGARACNNPAPLIVHPNARYSGLYFDPARNGEGVALSIDRSGNAVLGWYTYDLTGKQIWVSASAVPGAAGYVFNDAVLTSGARYGSALVPANVQRTPFGRLTLNFLSCSSAQFSYESVLPGYGSGTYTYRRLTRPLDSLTCVDP